MAAKAMAVLPQPTSPCTMRAMAFSERRSAATSRMTRRCAPVGAKGMRAQKSSSAASSKFSEMPARPVPRISRRAI